VNPKPNSGFGTLPEDLPPHLRAEKRGKDEAAQRVHSLSLVGCISAPVVNRGEKDEIRNPVPNQVPIPLTDGLKSHFSMG
jgi:hypothetical protein